MADITTDIIIENSRVQFILLSAFDPIVKVNVADNLEMTTPLPVWEGGSVMDGVNFPTIDREGTISGTVKVQGVLQNKARVNLYYRKSGQLIQSTFTDESGAFEFACGLNRNVADYYAVAITDEPYNAQIFDKITPA